MSSAPQKMKRSSGFKISRKPKQARVTTQTHPEILTIDTRFKLEPETIAAKSTMVQRKNKSDYKSNMQAVSPWDFPYIQSLLLQAPVKGYDLTKSNKVDRYRADVETCTRAYEESFMCEPHGDQRPCILSDECEGLKIPDTEGFVLREFLLPSQQLEYEKTGHYPSQQNRCIFCLRSELARALVFIRAHGMACKPDAILQPYRNLVNIPGEYRLEDCILSKKDVWEGIVDPVVLHTRNAYKFEMKDGKKTYVQWRFASPEHFLT